jgi:hypothetical protein
MHPSDADLTAWSRRFRDVRDARVALAGMEEEGGG